MNMEKPLLNKLYAIVVVGLILVLFFSIVVFVEEPKSNQAEVNDMPDSLLVFREVTPKEAGWRYQNLCIEKVRYRFIGAGRLGSILHFKENGQHQSCEIEAYPPRGKVFYKVCESGKMFYQFMGRQASTIIDAVNLDGTNKTC